MHGVQTSVAQEDQVVNVNDSRLLAINVAKLTLFPSSRRRADRNCAAIVLVRVARRNHALERCSAELVELLTPTLTKPQTWK